jgi:hypothetical protein
MKIKALMQILKWILASECVRNLAFLKVKLQYYGILFFGRIISVEVSCLWYVFLIFGRLV